MSTAKNDGDENGYPRRRCARLRLGLLPVAVLLIGGCDVVLGIEEPMRGARDGGPQALNEAKTRDRKDEADAGAPIPPDTSPGEPECEDGVLRCNDSTSGNRSRCTEGTWADDEPCGAKEQCDSQDGAECKALPVEGDQCDEAGVHKCTGVAKPERQKCDADGMIWVDAEPCASGEACDRTNGDCLPIVPVCVGHVPGDFVCDGATRHTCGQDLTASMAAECASAAHCQQSKGATCALCTQGEFRCVGATLETCNAAGDGWTSMPACASEALCNPEAGACTTATCTEGQRRCSGNRLEACNDDLTDWELVRPCEDGLCDQANGECDRCTANRCDGNTRMACTDGGQTLRAQPCEAPLGVCSAGECVECITRTDCTGGGGCTEVTCNSHNRCEEILHEAGWRCDDSGEGRECDTAGMCVDSALARLVPDRGPPGTEVLIRAKPGRFIHDPNLAADSAASGTQVVVSEDGATVEVDATVVESVGGAQRLRIEIPPRARGWARQELVSILLTYSPPADAGGSGGAGGAGGAGGGGAPPMPSTPDEGALEFRYMDPP